MSGDDLFLYASAIWGSVLVVIVLGALAMALLRARYSIRKKPRRSPRPPP